MEKPTIMVTGANGQLGKELRKLSVHFPKWHFLFLSREDLPIHHFGLLEPFFKAGRPDYCINCAAYTAVDKAESEKALAELINAEAVGVLAGICRQYHTRLIHISTDYVFDGKGHTPLREDQPTSPVNFYGATKLAGENACQAADPEAIIIRTSWLYSEYGNNFVKTMLRLLKERAELKVVSDQQGCPTYAGDLAAAILQIIAAVQSGKLLWQPGIFHFCNSGVISWFEFASRIAALAASHCRVLPIPTREYPTPAHRPAYSVLDNSKIRRQYQLTIPDWEESLRVCLKNLGACQ